MTDSLTPFAAESSLELARLVYAGTARKATRALAAVKALQACALFVPKAAVLSRVAQAIYYNASYDASERYETLEDFEEALVEDLDAAYEAVTRGGVACYVIRPFLTSEPSFLGRLDLGYFGGYARADEFEGLAVPTSALVASESSVSGLTVDEENWLLAAYRKRTINLVNLMRKLSTAMAYVQTALEREKTKPGLFTSSEREGDFAAAAAEVSNACRTDFSPAPMSYFGTEADRTNPLKQLPTTREQLACLLEA